MTLSLTVAITTIILIILSTIIKPSFKIKNVTVYFYYIFAFLGALVLLATSNVTFKEFINGLTGSSGMNPLKILILFISMTMISIFLDELGFFNFVASYVLKITKNHQLPIFFSFYFLIAILTMFTSNDIIIFTLTPFIIFFSKRAKIDPIPYLVSEFTCANTWSMMFVIGNPTNIYLSQSYNIGFLEYFLKMAIPTVLSGLTELLILYLIFKNKLKDEINHDNEIIKVNDKPLTIIGIIILLICTIFLVISSYINIEMYLISFISLITLLLISIIYLIIRNKKPTILLKTIKRAPYELIPFVISMFTIVLSLNKYGVTENIANILKDTNGILKYGISSFISSNLLNNIPMSIGFGKIIENAGEIVKYKAIYSTIIGSNLGAFLTPLGALAGIMWMNILKEHDIKFSFMSFIKYGIIISIPVLIVSLLSLSLFI